MLSFTSHLEAISTEAARLVEVATISGDLDLPYCPGWVTEDLVAHLTGVYRDWVTQLQIGDDSQRSATAAEIYPRAGVADLEVAVDDLTSQLARLGKEAPCWNWTGNDLDAGWVARRMALETAIHRVDVESARNSPSEVAPDLALDGIDEKFEVHLHYDLRVNPTATLHGSICFVAKDSTEAWTISVDKGRLRLRYGRGPASVAIVGTASEIFKFVWNRAPLTSFDLTGDAQVARYWRDLPC